MMKAMEAYRDAGFDGVMSESSTALPHHLILTTRSSDVGLLANSPRPHALHKLPRALARGHRLRNRVHESQREGRRD